MENLWLPTYGYIQITSASVSFFASFAMVMIVARSAHGLSSPQSRIFFGLCSSNAIQSLALITGPFSPPKSSTSSQWNAGNKTLCQLNGFGITYGMTSAVMYTLFLCIYYYYRLKIRMHDEVFTMKIERKLHVGIAFWNLSTSIFLYATQSFNPFLNGSFCFIASYPVGCRSIPDVVGECTRGKNAVLYNMIFTVGVPPLLVMCIIVILARLWCHTIEVVTRFRRNSLEIRKRNKGQGTRQHQTSTFEEMKVYRREMYLQGILFSLFYVVTYSLVAMQVYVFISGKYHILKKYPVIMACFHGLLPLYGLFNVLVSTRPNVALLRYRHSELSWSHCLWLVLKAGGETPDNLNPPCSIIQQDDEAPQFVRNSAFNGQAVSSLSALWCVASKNFGELESVGCEDGSGDRPLSEIDIRHRPEAEWVCVDGAGSQTESSPPPRSLLSSDIASQRD